MEVIGKALIVFSGVLLISVLFYVTMQIRHRERMALLEKDLNPTALGRHTFMEALRIGMAMVGAGIGFFIGIVLEVSQGFPEQIELPLYFAPVLICMGIALILFYRFFRPVG